MAFLIGMVVMGLALVALIAHIAVLIKMFKHGIGTGLFGFFCGLYAFIWGWQNRDQTGMAPIVWTLCIVAIMALAITGFLRQL